MHLTSRAALDRGLKSRLMRQAPLRTDLEACSLDPEGFVAFTRVAGRPLWIDLSHIVRGPIHEQVAIRGITMDGELGWIVRDEATGRAFYTTAEDPLQAIANVAADGESATVTR